MKSKTLTLGSLFDGSGGFPLGGILAGITPVWASEIEPFPVLVTHKRLPIVKHYGDVSTLSGLALSGHVHRRPQGWSGRRTVRTVPSGDPDHQGNEGENAWRISKILCLGERPRRFLLQRRR